LNTRKGENEMKRVILTSMLTAAGLLAQSGSAQTPAPAPDNSKATQTVKKHRHHKKAKAGKTEAAPAVQSNQAPAKK
jgi:hypothetical protein